jgi:hypothetical protein
MRRKPGVSDVLQELFGDVLGIVALGVVGLFVWALFAVALTHL